LLGAGGAVGMGGGLNRNAHVCLGIKGPLPLVCVFADGTKLRCAFTAMGRKEKRRGGRRYYAIHADAFT
jgi:hypothetical protein